MSVTYRIRNWAQNFENNRTRELKKMDWIPVPNKHDGDGFTELLDHPNGMAHYGAWLLMVQVASKCTPRGTLSRDAAVLPQEGAVHLNGVHKPHDFASLARVTRGNAKIFEEAIPRLIQIGWIEATTCDGVAYINPAGGCGKTAGRCGEVTMEGKGREGNGSTGTASAPDDDEPEINGEERLLLDIDEYSLEIPTHLLTDAFEEKWREWIEFRKTVKKSKNWVRFFKRQLVWLSRYSADVAVVILDKSLVNEYQGLFDPGHTPNGSVSKRSKGPNI